jgi:hypothetical protein
MVALMVLVTSLELQSRELAETRQALEGSQHAQSAQAKLTLLSTQINAANIRLNSNGIELSICRSQLADSIQHERMGTIQIATEVGEFLPPWRQLELMRTKIQVLLAESERLLEHLSDLEKLVTEAEPHARVTDDY